MRVFWKLKKKKPYLWNALQGEKSSKKYENCWEDMLKFYYKYIPERGLQL